MGRGNVSVSGPYEGLFYIDNDHIHVYRLDDHYAEYPETRLMGDLTYDELVSGEWLYDECGTMEEQGDIEECFIAEFTEMFPSFERVKPGVWAKNGPYGYITRRVILESGLFTICVEDNDWSLAVELIQKEEPWGFNWMENLQKRLYQRYLDGMRGCLLNRLPSIGVYGGAWTHKVITREEVLTR